MMTFSSPFRSGPGFGLICLLGILLAGFSPACAQDKPRPNVIVVLVDDLGWTDLGFMGSKVYETPNIDRLASEGMRFTQAYSACTVCSPTRAAMMTGKYPARLHVTDWIKGHRRKGARLAVPDWTMQLNLEETTIAEALKTAGYATVHIGKWHLGDKAYWPDQQGFDRNVGGYHRGQPPRYFAPYKIPTLKEGPDGEYLTDREIDEAIKFVEENKDNPFFIYLPHYTVHTPLQAKKETIEKYRKKIKPGSAQSHPVYAAMIEHLDEGMGRLLQALKTHDVEDRTIILFTSDNGGLILGRPTPVTWNAPLRAGKGSLYEGGVRVPLIIKWPGVTRPGALSEEPVMTIDYFPTILDMAGVSTPAGTRNIDGKSLTPILRGQSPSFSRDALYWHYPHYHPGGASPYGAIRLGDLKLIEFYEDNHLEMYDLGQDIGEKVNLANQMPWKAQELQRQLASWRASVKAQMPRANPDYNPAKARPLPHVARPGQDGNILLHSRMANVHGSKLRYEPEPHKNTLGYWTQVKDWASWDYHVPGPGTYDVEILQGCGPGNGGSDIEITTHDQVLKVKVQQTKGFQDFVARTIGRVSVDQPGIYTLSVKPLNKTKVAVMDLRQVVLKPVKN